MAKTPPLPRYRLRHGQHDLTLTFPTEERFSKHLGDQVLHDNLGMVVGKAWCANRLMRSGGRLVESSFDPYQGLIFQNNRRKPSHIRLTLDDIVRYASMGIITDRKGDMACVPAVMDAFDELKHDMLRTHHSNVEQRGAYVLRVRRVDGVSHG